MWYARYPMSHGLNLSDWQRKRHRKWLDTLIRCKLAVAFQQTGYMHGVARPTIQGIKLYLEWGKMPCETASTV
jgi:hypothetical protein